MSTVTMGMLRATNPAQFPRNEKPFRLACKEPNRYCICEPRYFATVKGAAFSKQAKKCLHPQLLEIQKRENGKWVPVPGVVFPKEPYFKDETWNPVIPE